MEVSLRLAGIEEKPFVWSMLQTYLAELSAFDSFDQSYPYFDLYWQEPSRKAYLIQKNDVAIGLIFLNKHSFSGGRVDYSIAEFYIKSECRGKGFGRLAIYKIFDLHPGQVELCVFNKNIQALKFWGSVLTSYKSGRFVQIDIPDKTIFRLFI